MSVAKARVELACPHGHDVLNVARIPVPPLGYVSDPYRLAYLGVVVLVVLEGLEPPIVSL